MLRELRISNFAIIDNLNIAFSEGLNVLSGETGAGKSIIVGALGLLLGGRASAEMIRATADEAVVEALFEGEADGAPGRKLDEWGIAGNDQLVIRRLISKSGKSRAYINSGIATLQMLNQLGAELIAVSGQHEHQTLLLVDKHIDMLDEFGALTPLRDEVTGAYRRLMGIRQRIRELEALEGDKQRRSELLRFQIGEIDQAAVRPGEEDELREEKKILTHAQKLIDLAGAVYNGVYTGEEAILGGLREAVSRLKEIAGIDASMAAAFASLETSFYQIEDVARTLEEYLQRIHFDAARLEAVETRLGEIQALRKKYGPSLEELFLYRDRARRELEGMESSEAELARLKQEQQEIGVKVLERARMLSAKRAESAVRLSGMVGSELASLGMKKARFSAEVRHARGAARGETDDMISLGDCRLSEKGIDEVEFYFGPNPGEGLKPLAKIASGGELSRLVLAIKKTVAGGRTTLIFDEVDSGIGGAVAEVVGRKLKEIAGRQQTICITHLPQIASFADRHHSISKMTRQGRTVTLVKDLHSLKDREDEVARMLGGATITPKTREHAREMLRAARGRD
jgi:DNA repair protein RecN (Recombination protein N)